MKLRVSYKDGQPIEISNHPGSPSFTFKMDGSTAVQQEQVEWHHTAKKITGKQIRHKAEQRQAVLTAVRDLPFVQAVETIGESDE